MVARLAHNQKVAGSSPAPAPNYLIMKVPLKVFISLDKPYFVSFNKKFIKFPNPFKWFFTKNYKTEWLNNLLNKVKKIEYELDEKECKKFEKILNTPSVSKHPLVKIAFANKFTGKMEYHDQHKVLIKPVNFNEIEVK